MDSPLKTAGRIFGALGLSLVLSLVFAYVGVRLYDVTFDAPLGVSLRWLRVYTEPLRLLPILIGFTSSAPAALIAAYIAGLRRWSKWLVVVGWTAFWTVLFFLLTFLIGA